MGYLESLSVQSLDLWSSVCEDPVATWNHPQNRSKWWFDMAALRSKTLKISFKLSATIDRIVVDSCVADKFQLL